MLIKQTTKMTERERIAAENSNNQYLQALSYVAVGTIYPFAGQTVPETFMLCDGSALDKTEYAELFSVIGYTFGGEGDIFNLPDLRGKALFGFDENNDEFNTLGKTGGAKQNVLNVRNLPNHRRFLTAINGANTERAMVQTTSNGRYTFIGTNGANAAANSGLEYMDGNSEPINNMPPYLVVNYIIKVVQNATGSNGEINIVVDQTYDSESENAQSGVALAPIFSKKVEMWNINTAYKVGDLVLIADEKCMGIPFAIAKCSTKHTSPSSWGEVNQLVEGKKWDWYVSEHWETFTTALDHAKQADYAKFDISGNYIPETYATKEEVGNINTVLAKLVAVEE